MAKLALSNPASALKNWLKGRPAAKKAAAKQGPQFSALLQGMSKVGATANDNAGPTLRVDAQGEVRVPRDGRWFTLHAAKGRYLLLEPSQPGAERWLSRRARVRMGEDGRLQTPSGQHLTARERASVRPLGKGSAFGVQPMKTASVQRPAPASRTGVGAPARSSETGQQLVRVRQVKLPPESDSAIGDSDTIVVSSQLQPQLAAQLGPAPNADGQGQPAPKRRASDRNRATAATGQAGSGGTSRGAKAASATAAGLTTATGAQSPGPSAGTTTQAALTARTATRAGTTKGTGTTTATATATATTAATATATATATGTATTAATAATTAARPTGGTATADTTGPAAQPGADRTAAGATATKPTAGSEPTATTPTAPRGQGADSATAPDPSPGVERDNARRPEANTPRQTADASTPQKAPRSGAAGPSTAGHAHPRPAPDAPGSHPEHAGRAGTQSSSTPTQGQSGERHDVPRAEVADRPSPRQDNAGARSQATQAAPRRAPGDPSSQHQGGDSSSQDRPAQQHRRATRGLELDEVAGVAGAGGTWLAQAQEAQATTTATSQAQPASHGQPQAAPLPRTVLMSMVEAMRRSGSGEVVLRHSKLGAMKLQMQISQGQVTARIVAANPQAAQLVRASEGALRARMEKQGLKLKSLKVVSEQPGPGARRSSARGGRLDMEV